MIFGFGDTAYIVENHLRVRRVMVLDRIGDMYTVMIGSGAIRIRHTRLYETKEEAEKNVIRLEAPQNPVSEEKPKGYRSPYDYWH